QSARHTPGQLRKSSIDSKSGTGISPGSPRRESAATRTPHASASHTSLSTSPAPRAPLMTWLRIASGGNSLFNSATARKPSSTADVSAEGGGGRDGEAWGRGDGKTGSSDGETGGRGDRECSTSASSS